MTKFDWLASESAPKNYPMKILSGKFIYPNNKSLYIPNGKRIDGGWGIDISTHIVGDEFKNLPSSIEIEYFSYAEDKFYKGRFELPYDTILGLFQSGYYSPTDDKIITYHYIVAGVAPGGVVSVWVSGIDKAIEVFCGIAEEVKIDWDVFTGEKLDISRKDFIDMALNEELSLEAKSNLLKNGVPTGLWTKYHQARYQWRSVLTDIKFRDNRTLRIRFFNGEQDYLEVALDDSVAYKSLAIPKYMSVIWERTGFLKDDLIIDISFNEKEIFSAFKTIAKDNKPIEMEFRMEPENNYDFTIWLRNDKKSIELNKTKIKTWKPAGMRYENAKSTDTE